MQTVLDKPTAEPDGRLCASDERRELAFLAQFMRHDSVASLAKAIAERLGGNARGGDLIVAAGLALNGGESGGPNGAMPVNPGAGVAR
jgi:hypothetical protein